MAAGPPEADPGARRPPSCAAAAGTPCALARGHRGPGNGIKHRETDGDSVTGRGNKEGIERRQEKSFSGWSENYLLGGSSDDRGRQPPPPRLRRLPSQGRPRPAWVPLRPPARVTAREVGVSLNAARGTSLRPPAPAPRLGPSSRRVLGKEGRGRGTETLRAKSWHPGLGTPGLRAEGSC